MANTVASPSPSHHSPNEDAVGVLATAAAAIRSSVTEPDLQRAQLSFGAIWASEWAYMVALAVVAHRDGGAAAVAFVVAVRMVPAAALGPIGAALADRFRRERVLVAAGLVRAAATAATAVAAAASSPLWTYGLAAIATVAFSVVRPAHSALLPVLCRTPQQLTSANAVRGLMDSASTLAGPAVAAAGLAAGGPSAVFLAVAVASAWSAALIARVRTAAPARPAARRLVREVAAGFTALAHHRDAALVVGLALAQTFTRGCLTVLTVVVAVDVLGTGDAGVAVLTAAVGAGAVTGSLLAGALAGSRALARWEGVGVALWGLPLIGCAALSREPAVLVLMALIGVGNALVDVGLFTLPARLVPDALVGRVFGVFEGLVALTVALGSLATPLLLHALGPAGALVAVGLLGPACVLLAWPRLRRIDDTLAARDRVIARLRRAPTLRALPLAEIERLAMAGAGARGPVPAQLHP